MKTPLFVLAALVLAFAAAAMAADDPFVGTWKMNLAKSKFTPGQEIETCVMTIQKNGDGYEQITDAVNAILESRRMTWNDLCREIAYFKHMAHLPIYRQIAAELNIPNFPLAVSHADICRQVLVFEIEVDAIQICLA